MASDEIFTILTCDISVNQLTQLFELIHFITYGIWDQLEVRDIDQLETVINQWIKKNSNRIWSMAFRL